jgi:integrase
VPTKHPKGIARDGDRWRVYVRVRGIYRSKLFPLDTDKNLAFEREALRVDLRRELERGSPPADPGAEPFDQAAGRYLDAVAALPTYSERERDIALWVVEFGARAIGSVTATDIHRARDRWLTKGPRLVQVWKRDPKTGTSLRTFKPVKKPLSASTVNHRLRALENLFTVLCGVRAPNPVREVPEAEEPESPPRALPPALVRELLDEITAPVSRAWLEVLAWTGIPPATVARMSPEHLDLDGATAWVPGRLKGQGTKGRRVPLNVLGVAAWRRFVAADAWRETPPKNNWRREWRAACRVVEQRKRKAKTPIDLSKTRPYDLRHSFGTMTDLQGGDAHATQLLLGVTQKTAERYAKAAIDPRLLAAVAKLNTALLPPAAPTAEPMPAPTPTSKRRGRKLRAKLRKTK